MVEEGLSAIDRNSQAQSQIIEDLPRHFPHCLREEVCALDVQRLNLADILDAALASVLRRQPMPRKFAFTRCSIPSVGPVTGGDPARLQQVVWNLLANARRSSRPRGGTVQVLLERVNSHVEIGVIDSGIGIKPEFLPRVFDHVSARADGSTGTRLHAGARS